MSRRAPRFYELITLTHGSLPLVRARPALRAARLFPFWPRHDTVGRAEPALLAPHHGSRTFESVLTNVSHQGEQLSFLLSPARTCAPEHRTPPSLMANSYDHAPANRHVLTYGYLSATLSRPGERLVFCLSPAEGGPRTQRRTRSTIVRNVGPQPGGPVHPSSQTKLSVHVHGDAIAGR